MPGYARRPCPAVGSLIPWRSWGGLGFNGGRLEWGGGGSPARGGSRSMHSSTIGRICAGLAVLRVPHVLSTARPRRIGSVVVLSMLGAPRSVPGTTAPPSGAAVIPGRRDPSPGRPHPPQVPPLSPKKPRHRPGGRPHPPSGAAVKAPGRPSPPRLFASTPAGHGRPAEPAPWTPKAQKTAIAGGRTRAWRSDGSGSPCRRSRAASRGATAAPRSRRRPCAGRASSGPRARLGRRGPGSSPST